MALKSATAKLPRLQLPEKFKGTVVERWANYWKGLANDYKGKKPRIEFSKITQCLLFRCGA